MTLSLDQVFVSGRAALLQLAGRVLPPVLMPWLSILLTIGVIAALAPAVMMYLTLIERKLLARMQNRLGPTRVGVYGLLQPLADGLKMLIKEDLVPRGADPLVHLLAPIMAVVPAILLFAVIPFGRNMAPANLNVGLLYFLAVSSVSSYAIFMGAWASRSKFSVIGAMRAVAQIISYEVPGVLSVVALMMVTGTMSLVGIVEAQRDQWFIATPWGFVGGVILFLSGIAEVNRTPFDMPEAESELVGGFHTEYSGMKFALWYMAEFLEAFMVCAITVTCFLGGWHGPAIPFWTLGLLLSVIFGTATRMWWPARAVLTLALLGATAVFGTQPIPSWAWFTLKTYALVFVLVWLRGTFPRLRVDQLMGLAWKFLLPMALVNVLAAGVWVLYRRPVLGPLTAGTLASTAMLVAAYAIFVRLNRPAPLERRTYLLAD